jgi:Ring hydroxylating alpha subunit (catalytic domain).
MARAGSIPVDSREHAFDLGHGHNGFEYPSPQPRPVALWHPLFGEEAREDIAAIEQEVIDRLGPERAVRVCKHAKHVLIFPNLVIADGPGAVIRTYWPVAPDYVEIDQWAVAGVQETPEQIERRVSMYVTFLGAAGLRLTG